MPAVIVRQVYEADAGEYALPQQEYLLAHDLAPVQIGAALAAMADGGKAPPPIEGAQVEWTRDGTAALVFLDPGHADAVCALLRVTAGFSLLNPGKAMREKPMPRRDAPRLSRERPVRSRMECRRRHSPRTDWREGKPNCGAD